MESNSLAKNLLYQRKLKGYTQEELSDRTNVAIRTIQRIENGETNPHAQTIKLLAVALEIEVDDLVVLENPKEEVIQKKWLLLLHATPILGLVLPLCNVLFPLFLWIHKREDNKIYDTHGRKIVNFQITMTIFFLLSLIALVTIERYGFFFFMVVIPFSIIITLINIALSINSQKCFYPLSFPFLRKNKVAKNVSFIIIFFVLNSVSNSIIAQDISRLDGSTISADSLSQKITQLTKNAQVHGVAISIFNDSKAVYQKTFGYKNYEEKLLLNESSNLYGASFSKAVFAVLVMKLVEENIIDLDVPLESYLEKKIYEYQPKTRWHDNFADLKKDSLYHKITARMCLSHTTGFPNYRWFEEDQKLRVKFEPGSLYGYSGEGFIYLQVVLERILGKGLEKLAQERIFEPLGMLNTSYQWDKDFESDFAFGHTTEGKLHKKDKDNEPRGGGTLETTAKDYTRFLEAVLHKKIISEASWSEIFRPQIRIHSERQFGPLAKNKTDLYDDIELSYALGWGAIQTPFGPGIFKEGHGDGFQHYSIIFPETGKGIMIMTNSDNGEGIFKELLEVALADIYTPWKWENYFPYDQR